MPKRRNLNGLPHNLIKSFFGTERYYSCGYMADWLLNAMSELKISEATIDIVNTTFEPADLNLYPLTYHLKDLKSIIEKELKANGFSSDFITEAKIKIEFLNTNTQVRAMYCYPSMIDKEGHTYNPDRIIENAYETPFNPFDPKNIYYKKVSFWVKLKSIF